jgi:hypothetical protein
MRKQKKFRKRHNLKLVKVRRTYSVEEICNLFDVHPNTVLSWINNQGLKRLDDAYPYLVYGQVLADFIAIRQAKAKSTLAADEFHCFKCGCARKAWESVVDIHIHTPKLANLRGLCAVCGTGINKIFGRSKMPEMQKIFKIQQVHNQRLIQGA